MCVCAGGGGGGGASKLPSISITRKIREGWEVGEEKEEEEKKEEKDWKKEKRTFFHNQNECEINK